MRLSMTLTLDPNAPSRARTALRAFSLGLAPPVLSDAQLVVSELVTEAVRHGAGDSVRVQLELLPGGRLRGEVDGGMAPAADPGDFARRLVDTLTSSWGASSSPAHVWFELGPPATA